MRKFSIKYKIVALVLVLAFTFQSMESINNHTYSQTGVYLCGSLSCTDITPSHLSTFCDNYH